MSKDLGTIFYEIDAKMDKLLSQSRAADTAIGKTEKSLSDTEKQMQKTNAAANELGGGFNKITSAVKAFIAASALREIASMVQGYEEMADRVRLATSSTEEFEHVQKRLVQTANGTYRSLSEAQEVYISTADSLRAMGYSTDQALDVADSLSYSFVTNATNAQKAEGAINAFSKAVTKGKVDADAWQTLTSAVPSIIRNISDATGKAEKDIRALGAAGKITAAQLTEGLRKSLEETSKQAGEMSNNLRDAGVRVQTALTAVFVSVEQQTGAWADLTKSIITAADWLLEAAGDSDKLAAILDAVQIAGTAVAAVMAGRLLTAIGAYIGQQTILIAGLIRQTLAERASATAALATAKAQLAVALSTADRTRATLAMEAAQVRLNAVTTAGSLAMKGLSSAMALLGGPGGLLLLAAAGLFTLWQNSKAAREEIDLLNGSLDKLSANQIDREMLKTQGAVAGLKQELMAANKQYADLLIGINRHDKEKLTNARAAIDDVNDKLKEQEAVMNRLAEARDKLNKPAEAKKKEADPVLVTPTDTTAEESAAKKKKTLLDANTKAVKELQQAEKEASLTSYELAEAQNLAKLNKYATPEQIQQVKDLTRAIYDKAELVKSAAEEEAKALQMQQALQAADPRLGAAEQYKTELAQYQEFKANQLITDQQYEELKNAAATKYESARLAAQEQMWAAQSKGNAFVLDSINALGQSSTQVLAGILSGTMTGQDAMRSLANTIFNQVIGAIVQMGVDQVKSIIMGQTAQAAAATASVAEGAAVFAAWTPAAIASSIASFGGAAVAGLAALPALLMGGRKNGGPVSGGGMYRVNEGGAPEIFTGANGSQYLLPNKNGNVVSNADATGGGGGITIQLINNSSRVDARVQTEDNESGKLVKFFIEDVESGGPMFQALAGNTNMVRVGQ